MGTSGKETITRKETEKKPIYTLEDFVATFTHRQELYVKYRKSIEYRAKGMKCSDIARELRTTQSNIHRWVNCEHVPFIERDLRVLEDFGLYPLYFDNPHLPLVAILTAWLTGDGHISRGIHDITFYEEHRDSLDNLAKSLQIHFPHLRISNVKKQGCGNSYRLRVFNPALAHFFVVLGVPAGNKSEAPFQVPQFVLNGSDEVKRNYIGTIICCEGSTPKIAKKHSGNAIGFSLSKVESLEKEHIEYMERLRGLLSEFGIMTSEVRKIKTASSDNPMYRFYIDSRAGNLMKFFDKISLEYFPNKQRGKEEVLEALNYHIERIELYHKALVLSADGKTATEISKKLGVPRPTVSCWINRKFKPATIYEE